MDSMRLDGLHIDPLGAFLMNDVTVAGRAVSTTAAHAHGHTTGSAGAGVGVLGGGVGGDNKNKNSSLRGTLQTSSTPTKVDTDRIVHSNNEHQKEGTLAHEIPDRKNSPPPSNGQMGHRRILSKREPLVCVERDSSHFDVLPRLPLTKLLLVRAGPKNQQISGQTKNDTTSASSNSTSTSSTASSSPGASQKNNNNTNNNNSSGNVPRFPPTNPPKPTQASSLYGLEQAASLVIFSRSGRLALSAGRVDGSVAVREVDPRTGFILSAADFHAHHHRVICLACDSIAFARTDVIASCDAYGQTLVWTVSRLKAPSQPSGVSSHVISRRPQRLFRCQASQHMKCEISWQLGLVVTVSVGVVHIFSVERDERLRAFEYDWEEELIHHDDAEKEKKEKAVMVGRNDEDKVVIVDIASVTHTESSTESESSTEDIPEEFEVNKKDFYSSDKTNTTGLSSTYRKRTVHKKSGKEINEDGQCKEVEEECSIARRIALCDDGSVLLHIEVTSAREESNSSSPLPPNTSTPTSLPPRKIEPRRTSVHYILSYSLSGVRTGRARMVSPVTFLSVPDRSSDIAIAGCEDGAVTIFRLVL